MLQVTLQPVIRGIIWAFASREHYNYTYDLTPRNLNHLAAFLAAITGQSAATIQNYVDEISCDTELRNHILRRISSSPEKYVTDTEVRYGRRVGWYALVRAIKPRLVVETGVDKGLGSVVLAAALRRNSREGQPARFIGIDIDPGSGHLFAGDYQEVGELIFKDSLVALRELSAEVDLFIHDSDHNPEFEAAEYAAVKPKLAPGALVLSDNAEHTDELIKFARETNKDFLFFGERPMDHWWPGEGIGIAYTRAR